LRFGFRVESGDAEIAARTPTAGTREHQPSNTATQPARAIHWQTWLLLLHFAGFAVYLFWLVRQLGALRSAVRKAHQVRIAGGGVTDGELAGAFHQIARHFGLRRLPRLMISRETNTPIAFGILRPTVMLLATAMERQRKERGSVSRSLAAPCEACRRLGCRRSCCGSQTRAPRKLRGQKVSRKSSTEEPRCREASLPASRCASRAEAREERSAVADKAIYSPARRVSASPKRSSLTPMRSMIDRYMLQSLRLSSPLSR
jgi:hypothetical protein